MFGGMKMMAITVTVEPKELSPSNYLQVLQQLITWKKLYLSD
jgi:hypothetical protein